MTRRRPAYSPPSHVRIQPAQVPVVVFVVALLILALPTDVAPIALRIASALMVAALVGDAVGRAIVPTRLGVGGRLALSIAAALAMPVAVAILLTLSPFGIGRLQLVLATLLMGMLASGVTIRRGAPIGPTFARPLPGRRLARLAILYLVAGLVTISAFAWRFSAPVPGEAPYSALSIGPGTAGDRRMRVEVVNQESTTVLYQVQVRVDGREVVTETSAVPNGASWEYTPQAVIAAGQRVEALLFRSPDLTSLYRDVNATVGPDW